jgi:hypothetical protein
VSCRGPNEFSFADWLELSLPGYEIQLEAIRDNAGRTGSVRIKTEVGTIEIKDFVLPSYDVRSIGKLFPARVGYLASHGPRPFLFLIGDTRIYFIAPRSFAVSEVVQLHRSKEDDAGFRHLFLHEFADSFLVRYETGVCRIDYDGALLWHTPPLSLNDTFVRDENGTLLYSNEFVQNGREWAVDFASGALLGRGRADNSDPGGVTEGSRG